MRRERHLFFIYSDFHYLICKSIISVNHIPQEECFFVCGRGTEVGDGDQVCPFRLYGSKSIWGRLVDYFVDFREIRSFFGGCDIIAYIPFRFIFPVEPYVSKIILYEEGFSAYKKECSKNLPSRNIIKTLLGAGLIALVSTDLWGYFSLCRSYERDPSGLMKLYVCSEGAYQHFDSPFIDRDILKISKLEQDYQFPIPSGSYFMVFDRFNTSIGFYSLQNYKMCLAKMVDYCKQNHVREVWGKLHPADWQFKDAKDIAETFFMDEGVGLNWYEGKLEMLAMQDNHITFLGTNSTILFYAPIFGMSNKSVSFSRYLASIDDKYNQFIRGFGGIDEFVSIFSEHVECLEFNANS